MKITLDISNEFIANTILDGISRSATWWVDTHFKDKIDDLELKVQDILDLAPNEIVEVDLEKALRNLEWARENRKEWEEVQKMVEQARPKASNADLLKRAKAAVAK